VVLAAVATAGSVMVSYARARAESLIPLWQSGIHWSAPSGWCLLIIGGLFNRMGPVLCDRRGFHHHRHSPHRIPWQETRADALFRDQTVALVTNFSLNLARRR